jgi:Tat protein secretion system quality control protein TatD with DNase activity
VVGQEVEAPRKAIVKLSREKKFTATVGLHPTDTKEAADTLSIARGQVKGV